MCQAGIQPARGKRQQPADAVAPPLRRGVPGIRLRAQPDGELQTAVLRPCPPSLEQVHYAGDCLCHHVSLVRTSQLTGLFRAGGQSSNIDLMQLHMYPDSWLTCNEECKRDWTIRWVRKNRISITKL